MLVIDTHSADSGNTEMCLVLTHSADSGNIEMCLLLIVFYLVAFAIDCVVSRNVIQLLTYDLVRCVFNWCKIILNCDSF